MFKYGAYSIRVSVVEGEVRISHILTKVVVRQQTGLKHKVTPGYMCAGQTPKLTVQWSTKGTPWEVATF
jgi:hypothetical protein